MTVKTSEIDTDYTIKFNKINTCLVIFFLLNQVLSYSTPYSLNPIFLTVYYICNCIIFILLIVAIYVDLKYLWGKYGK